MLIFSKEVPLSSAVFEALSLNIFLIVDVEFLLFVGPPGFPSISEYIPSAPAPSSSEYTFTSFVGGAPPPGFSGAFFLRHLKEE